MKRIHFVKLLFVVLLVSGSLNAWAAEGDKTTANFTSWSTSIQAYNATVWNDNGCSFTYASNNQKGWSYVRCGSKGGSSSSSTASGASTILYNTQFVVPIKMVVLNLNGISNGSSSSITITSVVIKAYSDKSCTKEVGTGTLDNIAYTSSNCPETIEITPSTQFPKDSYIKVFINWTAKGTKNSGLNITSINYVEGATSGSTETTPSITQQPKDATYDQGATPVALTVSASGNPTPTYQWYSNTSNENSNGTLISGETKDSYTPSTASTGTFYYYCVATNSKGSASSNVATITVNTVPTYTVQWKVGRQAYTKGNPTTSVASGSKVSTLPTAPADDAIGPCANTFMGWSTHDLGSETGQGDPGDLFTTIEGSPVITKNTIFYAVFATKQNGN